MREANFSNFALNRAAIVITNNMYDRRALDSTSTLPLSISLSNLLTLCNASNKIREQIAKDGAVEQLVCILKNRKYRNMQNKIWSLAFRCLAITAIRGNGKIRRKIIYSGTIPVIVERLLLQFQKVVEHIQKEQIEMYLSYQTESPQLVSGNEHSDSSVNDNNSNVSYLNDETNSPLFYNTTFSTSPKFQNYLYNEIGLSANGTNENVNAATALSVNLMVGGRRRRRSSGSSSYSSLFGNTTPQGKSQQELLTFYCYKQNIVKYMWHHVKKQGHNNNTISNTNGRNNGLDNIREEDTNETVTIQQEGINNLELIANPIPQPVIENANDASSSVENSEISSSTTNSSQTMNGNVYKILNLSELYPSIFKKLKFSVEDFVLALKMIACTCKYSDIRSIMSNQSHIEHDIYQLIEFFTTSSHPPEIRYWATIIMRNAFKKNSQNLRMCSNLNCLKMESYPREFSKCGRCQVNAYCSRECQKAAWITGHRHWCVDHSTLQQFNNTAALNALNASNANRIFNNNSSNTNNLTVNTSTALTQQQLLLQQLALQRQQLLQQQQQQQQSVNTTTTSA
ncbi:hypothetical protein BCR32DRAFT_267675 [Anaeromyces robustus]|uniref:MYND-type domain-containing protein n=1 Tax=Anaeromyces robustus TaxID=1754192 RepID=A0A1Y1X9E2_9FUNG|nr:hypothetical protein BCR32DRAFT_267675 [Anaeromyces robustus]|eukprot:ORX82372.1 hypothetical protein BCR32DRAFT_267675 [Anaeromyces robustus]